MLDLRGCLIGCPKLVANIEIRLPLDIHALGDNTKHADLAVPAHTNAFSQFKANPGETKMHLCSFGRFPEHMENWKIYVRSLGRFPAAFSQSR